MQGNIFGYVPRKISPFIIDVCNLIHTNQNMHKVLVYSFYQLSDSFAFLEIWPWHNHPLLYGVFDNFLVLFLSAKSIPRLYHEWQSATQHNPLEPRPKNVLHQPFENIK